MGNKVNLSSPWVLYFHELEAFFKEDADVTVLFDKANLTIKLYVKGEEKADALTQLLPAEKEFGSVTVKITVIPANKLDTSKVDLFRKALEGNNAVSFFRTITNIATNDFHFIVFKKAVVQYFTDDLGDINGIRSTLYQDIAKEIFGEVDGVFYCTDVKE